MTATLNPAPHQTPRPAPDRTPAVPTRPGPPDRRDNLMFIAVIVSGMALLTAVFGVGQGYRAIDDSRTGGAEGSSGAAQTATIHLSEFALTPATLEIASGGTITVHNDGAAPHNLAIEGTDLISPMLNGGESANLSLAGLAPGTYAIICQVVGHSDAGMKGTLVVKAGGGSPAAAPAGGHGHDAAAAAGQATANEEMDATMERSIKAFPAKTQGLGAQDLAPKVLADGTKQFDLTASVVKWEVEPGRLVDAWTYNGTVPGPTLRADHGDKVQVVLRNQLPESTAIHFHGLTTPNAADGGDVHHPAAHQAG